MQDNTYDNQMFAQFYDFILERVGLQDLELKFLKSCAECYGDPILEMGCGTGRILLPLAEMGYSVTGIDFSPHMLKVLEQKANNAPLEIRKKVQWKVGDMINPPINRQDFHLIIFCGAQLLHLRTDNQRLACLNSSRRLLADDGVLIISNSYLEKDTQPSFEDKPGKPEDQWIVQTRRVWKEKTYRHYFKLISKSKKEQEYLFWWSLYPVEDEQMKRLIEQAGFKYEPLSSHLPPPQETDIYLCKKTGSF